MENSKQHPKEVSQEFGKLIKQRREELGYTNKELALQIHSSESYLSRIQNHKRRKPNICIVYGLSQELEIDFAYLLKVAFPKM